MRSMAQDAFGRALSLAVPNTSVPDSRVYELALDVVRPLLFRGRTGVVARLPAEIHGTTHRAAIRFMSPPM
jgi:hypothetical protein